ncbi:hypothetical protein [Brachybacterium sp. YJGR34]|uniref:hypothetical protein n=1 Tax=Brachybacterium sp. YJGR34 TaxID=2059911 RepID=UPI000E0ADB58|nr:hypothetical protein [Brachybacterium sp. YJGR34]
MLADLGLFAGRIDHRAVWQERGFHSRDLASPRFTTVFPGYLTPTAAPASVNALASTLQRSVRPGSILSHTTAALLWGIPIPLGLENGIALLRRPNQDLAWDSDGPVIPSVVPGAVLGQDAALPLLHCRVRRGGTTRVGRGAVVHRGRRGSPKVLGALVVSGQAETLRELATMMPLWDVVAAVDAVIGPQAEYRGQTVASLVAAASAQRGLHGLDRLRAALAFARDGVRSPGETVMRLLLERMGFPPAVVNLPVRDPDSRKRFEIDLAWEDLRLGLEYDGDVHRAKGQWRRDEARRDQLASLGWTLVRANGDDLRSPRRLLLRLRRTMVERGVLLPSKDRLLRGLRELGTERPTLRIDPRRF